MTTLNATLPDYPTTAIEYRLERTFVSSAGTFLRGTLYADTTDASGVAATDLPTPDSGTAEYTLTVGTKRTRAFYFGADTSADLNDLLDAAGIDASTASLLEARVSTLENASLLSAVAAILQAGTGISISTAGGVITITNTGGGGGPPADTPSLDFSVATNSGYVAALIL